MGLRSHLTERLVSLPQGAASISAGDYYEVVTPRRAQANSPRRSDVCPLNTMSKTGSRLASRFA
jgi:hypothetical protein